MDSDLIRFLLSPLPSFKGVFYEKKFEIPRFDDFCVVLYERGHWSYMGRYNNSTVTFDSSNIQTQRATCGLFVVGAALIAPRRLQLSEHNRVENEIMVLELVERWMNRMSS